MLKEGSVKRDEHDLGVVLPSGFPLGAMGSPFIAIEYNRATAYLKRHIS